MRPKVKVLQDGKEGELIDSKWKRRYL
jgi:hypothetical protein